MVLSTVFSVFYTDVASGLTPRLVLVAAWPAVYITVQGRAVGAEFWVLGAILEKAVIKQTHWPENHKPSCFITAFSGIAFRTHNFTSTTPTWYSIQYLS